MLSLRTFIPAGLLLLVAATACTEVPTMPEPSAPSLAAVVTKEAIRTTEHFIGENDCTQEELFGFIDLLIQQQLVENKNAVSSRVTLNGHGSVTGSFGNHYQVALGQHSSVNVSKGETAVFQTRINLVSTGPGAGQNLHGLLLFKITVNANGTLTANVEKAVFSCDVIQYR